MKKAASKSLSRTEKTELKALHAIPDNAIDTDDIPEVRDWAGAKRGLFYRPIKQQLTLRLDADVIAWFKRGGSGYQSRINAVLREYAGKASRQAKAK